jgi:hypothetical protein
MELCFLKRSRGPEASLVFIYIFIGQLLGRFYENTYLDDYLNYVDLE